jgi:chromosome segregation ATPase
VNLLRTAAKNAHSKSLEKLAQAISTFDGPFDKIKQMIQKMIFRLMSEQKDEDDHKNWCDLENEKSTESKDDKSEKVDTFKAKIKEMNDAINLLVKQITANNKKAEQIQEHKATETELREENHAEIVATVKDSQDAQAAMTSAISVLKDFYKSSGMIAKEPWEFVQIRAHTQRDAGLPAKPETWDSSYSGASDPNGSDGVLSLLDATMQKFSQMEADAKVQDETDQKNYDQDMSAKTVQLAETNQDTSMKTSKKDSLQQKMEAMTGQLKHTTSEYDAVVQYLKDLVPACGEGDSSYDDRKKARADEITALRKAQTILEDAFRAK